MATNIIIGTTTQSNYAGGHVASSVGYNLSEGWAWGNSDSQSFSFANADVYAALSFNGGGGVDTLNFTGFTTTTGVTFNMGSLSALPASQSWVINGSSLGDTFQWNGDSIWPTGTQALSLNGGSGTDTLQLLNGTELAAFHLANLHMTNMEFILGSASSEVVYWSGTPDFTFDLAGGVADTLDISSSTSGKYLRMSGDPKYTNIEAFMGSSLADSLQGSDLATTETLSGGAGKDILWGAAGPDLLIGGKDSDTYYFGGGDGFDTITYDSGNSASDLVYFRSGYTLDVTEFAGLSFNIGADQSSAMIGIGGTDSLTLASWVNYSGTAGGSNPNQYRLNRFVTTEGTFGLALANDTSTSLFGTDSTLNYYMQGGANDDTLKASLTTGDILNGGNGNDLLWYSATAQSLVGGSGTDTLSAFYSEKGVVIDLRKTTLFTTIEYLQGSSVADQLIGTTVADTLNGGSGADTLWGSWGDDSIIGGKGADTMYLLVGDGSDTYADQTTDNKSDVVNFYDSAFNSLTFTRTSGSADNADVTIQIFGTTDQVVLVGAGTSMSSNNFNRVNKFITTDMTFGLAVGTGASETLTGTTASDYIIGGDGADTLVGMGGIDALYGQDGDDFIYYGSSAWIDGGSGTNTVSASTSTTGIVVLMGVAATTVANAQILTGSAYADMLGGTSNAETLQGGAGADSLWGGAGDDVLDGGNGADSYWFGNGDGNDTIVAGAGNPSDTVVFQGSNISISSTNVNGSNLTIGLSTGDSLTLTDWTTSSNKVNRFYQAGYGAYSLAVDSSNKATWTKIS